MNQVQENTLDWRTAVRLGLLGGVVTLYFGAIGMVLTFSVRNLLGTFINVGQILAVSGALAAGYLTGRAFIEGNQRKSVIPMGLLAG
ncbi:MAG TPA: hypothetical protein ENJ02_01140, partial [Chloroflexi bacterium]|nr:hypothetical protein [Chloroflexota bacterium]